MATAEINAIGRLWDDRSEWFGIARAAASRAADEPVRPGYTLVFGESSGVMRVAPEASVRGVLLALIAFFEGDAPEPPPELEMTHWEAAEAVRALAETAPNASPAESLRAALDAIDDGLPADVVTGFLYRSLEATSGASLAGGLAPIDELRQTYERLGR